MVDSGSTEMALPVQMINVLSEAGVPFPDKPKKRSSGKDFGDLEFIIGGDSYVLNYNEWMWKGKEITPTTNLNEFEVPDKGGLQKFQS